MAARKNTSKNTPPSDSPSPWTGRVDPRGVDATLRAAGKFREALLNNPAEICQVLVGRPDNLWLLWTLAMWDSDQTVRARALDIWEKQRPEGDTSQTVIEALASPYPDVIVWATKSLINWDGAVGPSVAAVLHDPTRPVGVRANAASVLSVTRGKKAHTHLVMALDDESPTIRAAAAMALGKRKNKHTVSALLTHINDPDLLVAQVVIDTLGNMKAIEALDPLIAILADRNGDPRRRRMAISALGKIGGPVAQKVLLDALADQDSSVRQAAALAIGDTGDRSNVPALIEGLNDPNHHVRATICRVLGRMGDPQALESLYRVLAVDPALEARLAACEALASLNDPDAIRVLIGISAAAPAELLKAIRRTLAVLLGDESAQDDDLD